MAPLNKVAALTSTIVCSIGLLYQCYHISYNYFKYTSTNKIEVDEPLRIPVPGFSACFPFMDIVDMKLLERVRGVRMYRRDDPNYTWDNYYSQVSNMTVADILDFSPRTEDVFGSGNETCYIRSPNERTTTLSNCDHYFQVEKYLHREFVCYKFDLLWNNTYLDYEKYILTPDYFGLILRININTSMFGDVQALSAYVHDAESIDLFDSFYAQLIVDRNENHHYFPAVDLKYTAFARHMLPAPYDTLCIDYPVFRTRKEFYYGSLNNDSMRLLGKVTPELFIYTRYNLSILNARDYQGETKRTLNELENKYSKYGMPSIEGQTCHVRFLLPRSKSFRNEYFKFSVFWPDGLFFTLTRKPDSVVLDYVIYICSSVGIWFGVSLLTLLNHLPRLFKNKESRAPIQNRSSRRAEENRRRGSETSRRDHVRLLLLLRDLHKTKSALAATSNCVLIQGNELRQIKLLLQGRF